MNFPGLYVVLIVFVITSCKTSRKRVEVAQENRKISAINNRDNGHQELESSIDTSRQRIGELESELAGLDQQSDEAEEKQKELVEAQDDLANKEENLSESIKNQVSSQTWQFFEMVKLEFDSEQEVFEKLCLEAFTSDNGEQTVEFEYCSDSFLYLPQQYRLRNFAESDAFINESNGLCLAIMQDSTNSNLQTLVQKPCDNSASQNFQFANIDIEQESFQLRHDSSGFCLGKDLNNKPIMVDCFNGGLRLYSNP